MEEEELFLRHLKPVIRCRGLLRKARERWACILKAFGRRRRPPTSSRRRPLFRLALCMQKASNYLKRKSNGKPFYTPSSIHVRGDTQVLHAAHHPHHPSGDDTDIGVSECLALLHLQEHHIEDHAKVNTNPPTTTHAPPLDKKGQFAYNHMMFSFNPKKHAQMAFNGDEWLTKRHKRPFHRRCSKDGTSTTLSQHKDDVPHDVPKGCVGIYVGVEHKRFIVPVLHLNHPLFAGLFECMHEDYGFSQTGPLWIPCDVSEFQTLHSHVKQVSKKYPLRF